jgi:alpha-methylacyl-CoA racemase
MGGPLTGLKVVELVGLGPGPFCGMLLADLGAEVLSVDRIEVARAADRDRPATNAMARGKRVIGLDLKHPDGVETFLRLIEHADAMFEVFRPGVAERLGIGPDACLARNPRLIYGRLTGWGQNGPYASAAGHDIDYIALAGALEPLGRAGQPPTPPINVLGDFAGGGMLLAFGIAAAAYEREHTGKGQVIDAAMVDGAALMLTPFYGARASGFWGERGTNLLDTGAPFYDVYETSDGKFISLGSLEPQFFAELVGKLGIDVEPSAQMDRRGWDAMRERFAALFKTKTRDEWDAILRGTDACYAPVLTMSEAVNDEHIKARQTIITRNEVEQPAPAPRFSRTAPEVQRDAPWPGQHTDDALRDWGVDGSEIEKLRESGAIA